MSQTILCEYIAAMEPEDGINLDIDKSLPDPKEFGFDSFYDMLVQAQDVMFELGESANRHKAENEQLRRQLAEAPYNADLRSRMNAPIVTRAEMAETAK